MYQTIVNHRQFEKMLRDMGGQRLFEEYRVYCWLWPLGDNRFGQLVLTHKNFYKRKGAGDGQT